MSLVQPYNFITKQKVLPESEGIAQTSLLPCNNVRMKPRWFSCKYQAISTMFNCIIVFILSKPQVCTKCSQTLFICCAMITNQRWYIRHYKYTFVLVLCVRVWQNLRQSLEFSSYLSLCCAGIAGLDCHIHLGINRILTTQETLPWSFWQLHLSCSG